MLYQKLLEARLSVGQRRLRDGAGKLDPMNLSDIVQHDDRRSVTEQNTFGVNSNRIVHVPPMDYAEGGWVTSVKNNQTALLHTTLVGPSPQDLPVNPA